MKKLMSKQRVDVLTRYHMGIAMGGYEVMTSMHSHSTDTDKKHSNEGISRQVPIKSRTRSRN